MSPWKLAKELADDLGTTTAAINSAAKHPQVRCCGHHIERRLTSADELRKIGGHKNTHFVFRTRSTPAPHVPVPAKREPTRSECAHCGRDLTPQRTITLSGYRLCTECPRQIRSSAKLRRQYADIFGGATHG